MRLSPKDLYAIRRAHLLAEHKALAAQLANHSVKQLTLELERRYALLSKNARLDINTGEIREEGATPMTEEAQ
ncbi:MAG: hypothetical protein V3U26_01595 [Dehalococcoidia bacterium]